MGLNENHALGRERKFFAVAEVTAGTFVAPASTDAAKMMKVDMSFEPTRSPRGDSRQTRSLMERITGKSKISWSAEGYLIPSGTAGTAPDAHLLFKAVMGSYANTPATSDVYTLANSQDVDTVSLVRHAGVVMEALRGAWVDTMTITASGGDPPKVKFEGGAMGHIHTGPAVLEDAISSSTTMVLTSATQYNVWDGSVISIGGDDNSDAGYEVTVDTARPSFTLGTSLSASDAAEVLPYTPSETTSGNPIAGVYGSLTVDGTAFPITQFEVVVKNAIKPLEDEAFKELPDDVIPGYREVTGSISVRARKSQIIELGHRKAFPAQDIAVTLGQTAGKRCKIDINTAEFDFAPLEIPEADEAVISLPFTALGSSGEDEISVTFD